MPTTSSKKTTVKKTLVSASTKKKVTPKKAVSVSFGVPLYNLKAEKLGEVEISKEIFGSKINQKLINDSIRIYLANQRHAHAKVKDRGEVAGTTKKMYAQKGTGRARHSTAKAPIFVGGGSAHGPQGNQNFKLELNQKLRRVALKSILSLFARDHKIIAIEELSQIEPKTKAAWNLIDKIEADSQAVANAKKIGIVSGKSNDSIKRSFRNIPGFSLISTESLNTYELSNQNILIFDRHALEALK